ncbi:MAG TPA: hypothetical protein VGH86_08540 [Phenylobacterium sp.]
MMTPGERKRLIVDTIAALARGGATAKAARICANGDVIVLTETPKAELDSSDEGQWVELAGKA